jgi:hypothetical protein
VFGAGITTCQAATDAKGAVRKGCLP